MVHVGGLWRLTSLPHMKKNPEEKKLPYKEIFFWAFHIFLKKFYLVMFIIP